MSMTIQLCVQLNNFGAVWMVFKQRVFEFLLQIFVTDSCDRSKKEQYVQINNSDNVLDEYNLWIYEMNDRNLIRDGREELGINCYTVLALPMKKYSVI